ncbi:MAG: DUF6541 family protein [Candidatus Dormibacteria bacterium]
MSTTSFLAACAVTTIVLLVPGFALATLIVPRWAWWERLAMAPGLTSGIVGILGLILHDVGVSFSPLIVLSVLAVPPIAASFCAYRRHGSMKFGNPLRSAPLGVAVALMTSSIAVGIFAFGVRHEPLPINDDPAVHAGFAQAIQDRRDALPALPSPSDHSASIRPRLAVEATAAAAGWVAGQPAYGMLLPIALVSATLLSLGLLQLARAWLGPGAASTLAPALGAAITLPMWPLVYGEYPLIVDATLVAAVILAALMLVRGDAPVRHCVLLTAATASIWVGHGLEVLTAAAVGAALVARELWVLKSRLTRRRAAAGLALTVVAMGAGAVLVTLLTHTPQVPTPSFVPPAGTPLQTVLLAGSGHGSITDSIFASVGGGPLLVPTVAGCVWALVRARVIGLVLTQIVLTLMYYDVTSHLRLGALWAKVFPWAVADRILGMDYWVLPILASVGTVWLVQAGWRLRRRGGRTVTRTVGSVTYGLAAAFVASGVMLGFTNQYLTASAQAAEFGKVSAADMRIFDAMRRRLPPGSVVLTDGEDDAGMWIQAVTPQVPFMTKEFVNNHPDDAHLVALQNACRDPAAAAAALRDVQAVFVGSRPVKHPVHPWSVDCVARVPGLTLVAREYWGHRSAALFLVR